MAYGLPQPQRNYQLGSVRAPSLRLPASQKGQGWADFASGIGQGFQNLAKGMEESREKARLAEAVKRAEKGDDSMLMQNFPQFGLQYRKAKEQDQARAMDTIGKAAQHIQKTTEAASTSNDPALVFRTGITQGRVTFGRYFDYVWDSAARHGLGIDPKADNWDELAAGAVKNLRNMDPNQKVTYSKKAEDGSIRTVTTTLRLAQEQGIANGLGIGQNGWKIGKLEGPPKAETFKPYTLYHPDGRKVRVRNEKMANKYRGMNFKEVEPASAKTGKATNPLSKMRLIVETLSEIRKNAEAGYKVPFLNKQLKNVLRDLGMSDAEIEDQIENKAKGASTPREFVEDIWDKAINWAGEKLGLNEDETAKIKRESQKTEMKYDIPDDTPEEIIRQMDETAKDHMPRDVYQKSTGQTWHIRYNPMTESVGLE